MAQEWHKKSPARALHKGVLQVGLHTHLQQTKNVSPGLLAGIPYVSGFGAAGFVIVGLTTELGLFRVEHEVNTPQMLHILRHAPCPHHNTPPPVAPLPMSPPPQQGSPNGPIPVTQLRCCRPGSPCSVNVSTLHCTWSHCQGPVVWSTVWTSMPFLAETEGGRMHTPAIVAYQAVCPCPAATWCARAVWIPSTSACGQCHYHKPAKRLQKASSDQQQHTYIDSDSTRATEARTGQQRQRSHVTMVQHLTLCLAEQPKLDGAVLAAPSWNATTQFSTPDYLTTLCQRNGHLPHRKQAAHEFCSLHLCKAQTAKLLMQKKCLATQSTKRRTASPTAQHKTQAPPKTTTMHAHSTSPWRESLQGNGMSVKPLCALHPVNKTVACKTSNPLMAWAGVPASCPNVAITPVTLSLPDACA